MKIGQLSAAQETRIKNAMASVPYAQLLGIELLEIEPGIATLGMEVRHDLTQNHGVIHGGAVASLIDSATAFALISLLPEDEKVTTIDLTINFLRPVTNGMLKATAKVVRAGRRVMVVSADAFDAAGNLTATALSTYIKISVES